MAANQFLIPANNAAIRGLAAPGATASLYATGTLTPQPFYADTGLSVSLGSTITANGVGVFPTAYQDGATAFRLILKDRLGATLDGGDIDPFHFGIQAFVPSVISSIVAASRTTLAATLALNEQAALLTETGREGSFAFSTADLSAQVAADAAQGIYVAPVNDLTGASGAWVRKFNGAINPSWFGATADGITDDTAALQAAAALAKVIDLGGSDRTYKVSAAIAPSSGTVIRGHGATIKQTVNVTSIIDVTGKTGVVIDGVVFQDTGAGYVASDGTPNAAVFGDAGTGNIAVRNCTFTATTYAAIRFKSGSGYDIANNLIVGPGQVTIPNGSDLRAYGILLDAGCSEYRVVGNDVSGGTHGIRIEQSLNGVVQGNTVHDISGQHGFYIGAGVQGLAIGGNEIFHIPLQGIKVQAQNGFADSTDIAIVGNVVKTCGDSGITTSNGAGGTAQAAKVRRAVVANNVVEGCTGSGLSVQNTVDGLISGNVIMDSGFSGISHSACDSLRITHNHITAAGLSGIRDQTSSSNIVVDNNVLHNVATLASAGDRFGIFFQNIDHATVSRNRVTTDLGGMQYGIYLAAGDQTTTMVNDNVALNADEYAFRCASAVTAFKQFKGNVFEGTLGAAVNNPSLPSVASAAALVLPTGSDVVLITGTTNITSISPLGHTGHRVTLVFADALTVTRGSNLFAATNFVTTINDTITLICDGNNWLEVARSVN